MGETHRGSGMERERGRGRGRGWWREKDCSVCVCVCEGERKRNLVNEGAVLAIVVEDVHHHPHSCCRANLEQIRQSRPDSGLGLSHFSGKSL